MNTKASWLKATAMMVALAVCGWVPAHANSDGSRTITFVNNCPYSVWFAMAGGGNQGKSGSSCSKDQDCWTGQTCDTTNSLCFWNNPNPANKNFQLQPNGGTNQVTIPASPGSNVVWSGVMAASTGCDANGYNCTIANCSPPGPKQNNPGRCAVGTGLSQPATQAEFTMSSAGTDFYDIEVINGITVPTEILPNNVPANPQSYYTCGNPGGVTPQTGMGACNWNGLYSNLPTKPNGQTAYEYVWVQNNSSSPLPTCSSNAQCTGGQVCGLRAGANDTGTVCGTFMGYWTAGQACGINNAYATSFFHCNASLGAPHPQLTMSNLYGCTPGNYIGSCYQKGASTTCCGCANWDQYGVDIPTGANTTQCQNQNPIWVNGVTTSQGVLPTILWIKKALPTVYTYPYDDMSSTFTCSQIQNGVNNVNYTVTFCPGGQTGAPPATKASHAPAKVER